MNHGVRIKYIDLMWYIASAVTGTKKCEDAEAKGVKVVDEVPLQSQYIVYMYDAYM